MERPQKAPERHGEIRDPKLPVIHGEAPHNRAEDHRLINAPPQVRAD